MGPCPLGEQGGLQGAPVLKAASPTCSHSQHLGFLGSPHRGDLSHLVALLPPSHPLVCSFQPWVQKAQAEGWPRDSSKDPLRHAGQPSGVLIPISHPEQLRLLEARGGPQRPQAAQKEEGAWVPVAVPAQGAQLLLGRRELHHQHLFAWCSLLWVSAAAVPVDPRVCGTDQEQAAG